MSSATDGIDACSLLVPSASLHSARAGSNAVSNLFPSSLLYLSRPSSSVRSKSLRIAVP